VVVINLGWDSLGGVELGWMDGWDGMGYGMGLCNGFHSTQGCIYGTTHSFDNTYAATSLYFSTTNDDTTHNNGAGGFPLLHIS